MSDTILTSMLDMSVIYSFLACTAVSLICGILLALVYRHRENPSRSFAVTIALLPFIVEVVILMVNDSLGVGVAVAGAFSLVRFRSMPGKASDILIIFASMAVGLCTGMGYAVFALISAGLFAFAYLILSKAHFLAEDSLKRSLRITIPEDLDYPSVFDEIFARYAKTCRQVSVRTVNLGTMYQITYDISLKDAKEEKQMIDEIRVRNGNLSVISSRAGSGNDTL
jgi:hypothetical protein